MSGFLALLLATAIPVAITALVAVLIGFWLGRVSRNRAGLHTPASTAAPVSTATLRDGKAEAATPFVPSAPRSLPSWNRDAPGQRSGPVTPGLFSASDDEQPPFPQLSPSTLGSATDDKAPAASTDTAMDGGAPDSTPDSSALNNDTPDSGPDNSALNNDTPDSGPDNSALNNDTPDSGLDNSALSDGTPDSGLDNSALSDGTPDSSPDSTAPGTENAVDAEGAPDADDTSGIESAAKTDIAPRADDTVRISILPSATVPSADATPATGEARGADAGETRAAGEVSDADDAPGTDAVQDAADAPETDGAPDTEPAPDTAQLEAAQRTIAALTEQIQQVTKQHAIEFGRLESGALTALEDTITASQEREQDLADRLEQAIAEGDRHRDELEMLRNRAETLQSSLAQRDARLAELHKRLTDMEAPER